MLEGMKNFSFTLLYGLVLTAILNACSKQDNGTLKPIVFEGAQKVNVIGYIFHSLEPFLSRHGKILLSTQINRSKMPDQKKPEIQTYFRLYEVWVG
jgi:hypothetical protein